MNFLKRLFNRMKRYEKELLNHLSGNTNIDNVPLQNVKNAMGSIGFVKGNPLTKTDINISVNIYYVDIAIGNLLPAAALPAVLQQGVFPIYIFGLMDYLGGYRRAEQTITHNPSLWGGYTTVATPGFGIFNNEVFWSNVTSVAAVFGNLVVGGDFVSFYTAVVGGVRYVAMIVIHCNNVSYGTFLNSFVSDLITVNTLRYILPIANINQFDNTLLFIYQTLFGKSVSDQIDPRMYITSKDFQQQICDIPVNLPIDKALIMAFYLNATCQQVNFILFVEKVEALTNRPKRLTY